MAGVCGWASRLERRDLGLDLGPWVGLHSCGHVLPRKQDLGGLALCAVVTLWGHGQAHTGNRTSLFEDQGAVEGPEQNRIGIR